MSATEGEVGVMHRESERDPLDVAYDVFDRNCSSRATLDDVTPIA
jgi:hypothetical protein